MPQQPPTSTLFPYTTLFRSQFTYINKTVVDFIARPLLKEIFVDGKQVHELPDLEEIKEYAKERLSEQYEEHRRILNPEQYPVDLSQELYDVKVNTINYYREKPDEINDLNGF